MLYAILLLILLFLLAYVFARWLRLVLREGRDAAHDALAEFRGAKTPQRLVADARAALKRRGGTAQFLVVSNRAPALGDTLKAQSERGVTADLPEALLMAVALDVSHGLLYLHGFAPAEEGQTEEFEVVHGFSEMIGIDDVANPFATQLTPGVSRAVRLIIDDGEQRSGCLPVEAAWHIGARDLAARLRNMIEDRQMPGAVPIVLH